MSRPRYVALAPTPSLFEALRSDDSLAELLADRLPTCRREPSDVQLRRCPLDHNAWAPAGSHAAGACLCCNTPFPLLGG